ncbi:DUF4350 domain-containing protein [Thermococcus sp. 21S9]|uniref:DUF4350 domain-containing protein n=1 Tax=Thermococcus sp. 21S9 TaxID=1638223 RepID=UPI00143B5396|nr:DUF4350 domain-containing protein [Thermococcus sp. 21S9]NJE55353.1 DNRLRE domain-containing protein [Thermococcus sp. 21S9]
MKRLAVAIVLLFLVGLIPTPMFAEVGATSNYVIKTVSIGPTDDAYVKSTTPDTNYGSSYNLYVGTYYRDHGNERAYLKFDLSSIPPGAVIVSATLHLYTYWGTYAQPINVSVYAVENDSWSEDTITWDNKPLAGQFLDKDLVPDSNRGDYPVKHWSVWNVTDFVRSQFETDKVVSFVLISDSEGIVDESVGYNSKESKYVDERPYLEIVYYVPVAVSSLNINEPLYSGLPSKVYVSITNSGDAETNVTFYLKINGVPLYTENLTLGPKSTETLEKVWIPTATGDYNVTAEIVGEGVNDFITKQVHVYVNPYRLFYGLTYFYENGYNKIAPQLDELYANFTTTVQELQKCGVNLGDLSDDVKWIETNYNLTKAEYAKFLEMKKRTALFLSGNRLYTYSVMVHIRKARFLAQDVTERIEKVLPILQETLAKVEPLCHPPANETNQTANQTTGNVTAPSNGTVTNQTTANYTIHITKVLIDLSHGQYYFTKYGFTGLQEDIEKLGWEVNVTYAPLTYDELKKYDVVILTNPKTKLSDEEIQALRKYVEEGGALFVAGDWYKYLSDSLNELLEGTGVQFEKTELMDDEKNSGKPYYPFVGIYNRNCAITKYIPENWTMYYNGDTLKITGDAKWIIKGYESAYAVDANGNTIYEKGSEPVVAVAVTFGKGKIVVYGSSKALSDAYYGKYIKSNWPFIKGALLWLVEES